MRGSGRGGMVGGGGGLLQRAHPPTQPSKEPSFRRSTAKIGYQGILIKIKISKVGYLQFHNC